MGAELRPRSIQFDRAYGTVWAVQLTKVNAKTLIEGARLIVQRRQRGMGSGAVGFAKNDAKSLDP